MLTFAYTARDTATNKIVKSTVQAESERMAAKLLMSRNLVPSQIVPADEKANLFSSLKNRVSGFTREGCERRRRRCERSEHGSEADPGTSPTAKRQRIRYILFTVEKTPALSLAGMPKKKIKK